MAQADYTVSRCRDDTARMDLHANFIQHASPQLKDGDTMLIREMRNDKRHGTSVTFTKVNGAMVKTEEENYEYGELDGKCMRYSEDGIPLIQSYYQCGRLFGPSFLYKENGALDKVLYFENDIEKIADSKALTTTLRHSVQWADNMKDMACKLVGLPIPTPVERAERQFEWMKRNCFKPR